MLCRYGGHEGVKERMIYIPWPHIRSPVHQLHFVKTPENKPPFPMPHARKLHPRKGTLYGAPGFSGVRSDTESPKQRSVLRKNRRAKKTKKKQKVCRASLPICWRPKARDCGRSRYTCRSIRLPMASCNQRLFLFQKSHQLVSLEALYEEEAMATATPT